MLFSIFNSERNLFRLIGSKTPLAISYIKGNSENEKIKGSVKFYAIPEGTVVVSEIFNLPSSPTNFFAQHIHENGSCEGDFSSAGEHYNPTNTEHPCHAGDLPPLLSNNGYAWQATLDNRFTIQDIIGKTYIIHSSPDDFHTQPSGNSGTRIACGVIERVR